MPEDELSPAKSEVDLFVETYVSLLPIEYRIRARHNFPAQVAAAIAGAAIELIDRREREKLEHANATGSNRVVNVTNRHNHYHPTSDQVLKAVGDVVIIEPKPDPGMKPSGVSE